MQVEYNNAVTAAAERQQVCYREQIVIFGLLLLVIAAIYSSALFLRYGLNDDYGLLMQGLTYAPQIHMGLAAQGRPIFGWLAEYAFTHIGNTHHFVRMRAISMLGMAISAWMLTVLIRRAGWDRIMAISVAIAASAVPASLVYATWATDFPVPWAVICALGSGWLIGRALDRRFNFWLLAASVVLLITAIINYQPTGMLIVPVMLLDVFSPRRRQESALVKIGQLTLYQTVNAVGLIGGFLTFHWGMWMYPVFKVGGRTGFDKNLAHKPLWFLKGPLCEAMNLWHVPASQTVAVVVGVILLAGLLLYVSGNWEVRLLMVVVCLVALPASYLPNLISEDADAYRDHIALSWTILVLALFALTGIWQGICALRGISTSSAAALALPRGALIAGAIAAGIWAAYISTVYVTWPQAVELAYLRLQMARPENRGARRFIFLEMSNWNDTAAPQVINEEIGYPSIANPVEWKPRSALFLVRLEQDPTAFPLEVTMVPFHRGKYSEPVPRDTAVIDMRYLRAAK